MLVFNTKIDIILKALPDAVFAFRSLDGSLQILQKETVKKKTSKIILTN